MYKGVLMPFGSVAFVSPLSEIHPRLFKHFTIAGTISVLCLSIFRCIATSELGALSVFTISDALFCICASCAGASVRWHILCFHLSSPWCYIVWRSAFGKDMIWDTVTEQIFFRWQRVAFVSTFLCNKHLKWMHTCWNCKRESSEYFCAVRYLLV